MRVNNEKKVFVKINCNLEKELDKKRLDSFFEKLKMKLKIDNSLIERDNSKEKKKKI
jgi:hypothetical protein